MAFQINNSAPYSPQIGAYLNPGRWHRKGTPDILGIWLTVPLGIEVKQMEGVQSMEQKDFEKNWVRNGGIYILAKSIEDVEEGLKVWEKKLNLIG